MKPESRAFHKKFHILRSDTEMEENFMEEGLTQTWKRDNF